jgi:hypothetical protein
VGGGFCLLHDLKQLSLRNELTTGNLGVKLAPDKAKVFLLDILIQAHNLRLQINISNWSKIVKGTYMFNEGDWWVLDNSHLEKLSGM